MNAKLNICTGLLFSSLALSAGPAGASHSVFSQDRFNTGGTSTRGLQPHSTHFCYLSRVGVANTDIEAESATCNVKQSGAVWILEAILGESNDANVFCSATCVRY